MRSVLGTGKTLGMDSFRGKGTRILGSRMLGSRMLGSRMLGSRMLGSRSAQGKDSELGKGKDTRSTQPVQLLKFQHCSLL